MHRKRVVRRTTKQPVAEARYFGAIGRPGWRDQPIARSSSVGHAVATIAWMMAEAAIDQQIHLALDKVVQARRLQDPQPDLRMRGAAGRGPPPPPARTCMQAPMPQHPSPRLPS